MTTTTDVNGYYFFTPPPLWDNEQFEIVVFGGNDRLDWDGSQVYDSTDPTSGEMPDALLDPARRITGVVRDAGTGLPLDDVLVIANSVTTNHNYAALPPTDSTGVFSIGVPPGDDYNVFAIDGSGEYDIQIYDHRAVSICACFECGRGLGAGGHRSAA